MNSVRVGLVVLFTAFSVYGTANRLPSGCHYGQECIVEVAGTMCADGTPSYITITAREKATSLLVYLNGGGACWDKATCRLGYAMALTRKDPANNWTTGQGIKNESDPSNPFAKKFTVVTVPYCTGDIFTGDKVSNYGTAKQPYLIRHKGYSNVVLSLEAVKKLYPFPEKVVLMGGSAGGIGAYFHLRNLVAAYPTTPKYVLSDAGTPFKPPHLYLNRYNYLMDTWGAAKHFPRHAATGELIKHFGDLIAYNTKTFPEVRFGFMSGYTDYIMTFFAYSIGSPYPFFAVRRNIVDIADNYVGRDTAHARVFYLNHWNHEQAKSNLEEVKSMKWTLGRWMNQMLNDGAWENVRPDITGEDIYADASTPVIHNVEELRNSPDFLR